MVCAYGYEVPWISAEHGGIVKAVIHVIALDGVSCTYITIILCTYECICYFEACKNVIYESNALYVVWYS